MKKPSSALTLPIVAVILVASVAVMKWVSGKHDAAARNRAGARDAAVSVRTAKVGRADIDNILVFNGDIEALRSVELQPKISGRLQKLELPDGRAVEEGISVKAGALIAQIDDREYNFQLGAARAKKSAARAAEFSAEASLNQRQAAVAAAKAATANSQANYNGKLRELERQQKLFASNATTSQSVDLAQTEFEQAEAELSKAKANEQSAEAEIETAKAAIQQAIAATFQAASALEEAELNFAETRIYAPMDCVVSEKYTDPGTMLSSSTPIVKLVAMDTVKAMISVPVNQLEKITPGKTKATLTAAGLAQPIECTIGKIYPTVNLATRTAQVEIRVTNPQDEAGNFVLRPGMYVSVSVLLEQRQDVVAIDVSLPIRNLTRHIVYVCNGDTVTARPVTLGGSFGDLVEVVSGLDEGEEIVVQGQHRLTDGSQIRRVNNEE